MIHGIKNYYTYSACPSAANHILIICQSSGSVPSYVESLIQNYTIIEYIQLLYT